MNTSSLPWLRLLLASLAIIAAFLILESPTGRQFNARLLDAYTRWQADEAAPPDVVIIDIDDASLQQVAPWPWPRQLLADLIRRLAQTNHLRGIALDMVFPEDKDKQGDERLAQVISRYGVCVAHAFDTGSAARSIGYLATPTPLKILRPISATGYVGHYRRLALSARCSGHITPHVDRDGVVRRMPTGFRYQGRVWPWLAGALTVARDPQPVQQAYLAIPYRHQLTSWRAVPAHAIFSGALPPHALDGTWVLIGSTALGLNDAVVTPLGNWTPGIVLHAELLDARLHPLPSPVPGLIVWPWMVVGLITLLTLWGLAHERLLFGATGLVLLNGAWLALADLLWLARQDFWVMLPLVATLTLLLVLLPFEWRWVLRRHWRLARLFRSYLAPVVVERLLRADDAGHNVLNPQKRQITVMFADIEGFTQLSRELPTDQLARLTRDVLSLLTEQVHHFEGTLDKYIGDAVMALWNAPLDQPDHADRAMQCALSMVQALEKWNRAHPEWPDIRIHIAINTGEAMVGDLGTSLRHTYTAIGHTVNQADRLLDCARDTGREVVVSAQTAMLLQRSYPVDRYCVCQSGSGCLPPKEQERLFE